MRRILLAALALLLLAMPVHAQEAAEPDLTFGAEKLEHALDEETREFFAWLNYRAALPLIAKIKSAAIERVRHMRDYDALAAEGDAETLAELAVSRAVELVLGGMKEKVNVQSMKDCLEHIRKGSGR